MREKIAVINGLRGIAILAVILLHLALFKPGLVTLQVGSVPFYPLAALTGGHYGVILFFVLSGFVLHLPYARGERTMASRADAVIFWRRRAARLLPLYALAVLVGMAFIHPHGIAKGLIVMGTLTFPFVPSMEGPPVNTALWTLGVEFWMSMLLPLLQLLGRRIGFGPLAVLLSAVAWASWTAMLQTAGADAFGIASLTWDNGVTRSLDDFLWGMWLAQLYANGKAPKGWPWLLTGLAILAVLMSVADARRLGMGTAYTLPLIYLLLPVGMMLVTGALLSKADALVRCCARLASLWPLQMAGLMCYSLYVWQLVLIAPLRASSDAAHLLRYALVLTALSWITYRYVEFGREPRVRALLPSRTP